jgi:hypothetical protein
MYFVIPTHCNLLDLVSYIILSFFSQSAFKAYISTQVKMFLQLTENNKCVPINYSVLFSAVPRDKAYRCPFNVYIFFCITDSDWWFLSIAESS